MSIHELAHAQKMTIVTQRPFLYLLTVYFHYLAKSTVTALIITPGLDGQIELLLGVVSAV